MKATSAVAWNTGAHYTANGQRISALVIDDGDLKGHVAFYDIDRGIDGITTTTFEPDYDTLQGFTMSQYDYGHYTSGLYGIIKNGTYEQKAAIAEALINRANSI